MKEIIENYKKIKDYGFDKKAINYLHKFEHLPSKDILMELFLFYKNIRDFHSAEKYMMRLCKLEPNNIQFKLILSTISLAICHFEQGFSLLENRFQFVPQNYPDRVIPLWKKEKDKYKKIVVFGEQGFGDCFMYGRFLNELKKQFDRVDLCVSPPLVNIFKNSKLNIDNVFTNGNIYDYDFHTYICSLPYLLDIDSEKKIANNFNYLQNGNKPKNKKIKIGLCLHGRLDTEFERTRAIDIKYIQPLIDNKNIELHSVYIPHKDNQEYKELVKQGKIIEHPEIFSNFELTQQILEDMDFVISSDTAIVHLSGTLGKDTLLMLPRLTDWRWKTEGVYSYWYPDTVKIFRQEKQGEWNKPAENVLNYILQKINN